MSRQTTAESSELKELGSFVFLPPADPELADFAVAQCNINTGTLELKKWQPLEEKFPEIEDLPADDVDF